MKKILIMVAIAITSFASAQKGTYLVDGSFAFSNSKNTNTRDDFTFSGKSNSFYISPKVGYQFKDNWTAGLQTGISFSSSESSNSSNPNAVSFGKSNDYYYGGFLRYNKKINDRFLFFVDLGAGFENGKSTFEWTDNLGTYTDTTKSNGLYIGITPTISLNIINNFRLNISVGGLGYSSSSTDYTNVSSSGLTSKRTLDTSGLKYNFGQSWTFGISKNF